MEGAKGENWYNCNSMINKRYFLKKEKRKARTYNQDYLAE